MFSLKRGARFARYQASHDGAGSRGCNTSSFHVRARWAAARDDAYLPLPADPLGALPGQPGPCINSTRASEDLSASQSAFGIYIIQMAEYASISHENPSYPAHPGKRRQQNAAAARCMCSQASGAGNLAGTLGSRAPLSQKAFRAASAALNEVSPALPLQVYPSQRSTGCGLKASHGCR